MQAFLSDYLNVVKRLTTPSTLERNYFTELVETHRPVLKGLLQERQGDTESRIASSIESPAEKQPGRSGTATPYPLDSSL